MRRGLSTWLLVLCTSCLYSKSNREGIELSCAELGDGNACREGIITSCLLGEVQYRVCDDKHACTAGWQQPARYRCEESDGLPMRMSAGSAGRGGTSVAGVTNAGGRCPRRRLS